MTNRRLMKRVAGMSYVSPPWLAVATAAFVAGCGGGEGGNPQTPNEARLQVARSGDLVAYFKAKIAQRVALGYPGTAVTVPTVGGLEQRRQRGHPHGRTAGRCGGGGRRSHPG